MTVVIEPTTAASLVDQAVQRLASAENDLVDVLAESARSILDDPGEAAEIAARLTGSRAAVDLAVRAVAEAARREREANRQALLQRADDLEPQINDARQALDQYDAKAAKLRKQLEDFTGVAWVEADAVRRARSAGSVVFGTDPAAARRSRRRVLQAQLESLISEQEQQRRTADNAPLPAVNSPEWAEASVRLHQAGETLSALSEANLAVVQAKRRLAEIDAASNALESQIRGLRSLGGELDQLRAFADERRAIQSKIADAEDQIRRVIGDAA